MVISEDFRLNIRELNANYGQEDVLKNINMTLIPGEVNVLIGVNGSGKTTLLKSISGIIKPSNGKIKYSNIDLIDISDRERGKLISFIPQNLHTTQNYSVLDIVVMGITPYIGVFDMPSQNDYNKAREILKELNISHLENMCIGELSGGERRIVYLGRVLMQNSKILLLDEPNTFLDYVRQHDFFEYIKSFILKKEIISLFTLHDINLALRYGDKIHVLSNKTIVKVIDRNKIGYENDLVDILKEIYLKDFEVVKTKFGSMIMC